MRDYYKSILKRMPDLIGVDPYKSMGETQEEVKKSVSSLLDALENVSKLYSYIPEKSQQEIIERQLLVDKDWLKLNARLVSKWLEQNGKHYFKEEAHKENEVQGEPLTGEARDKRIQEFLQAIASATTAFTNHDEAPKGNGARMREQLEANGIVKKVSALDEACGVTEEMKDQQTKPE